MKRDQTADLQTLAQVFFSSLSEDSTWDNPFCYQKWKPEMVIKMLGEEPNGEFSELHQDYLSDEQRHYAYTLYKSLPEYLRMTFT